MCCCVCGGACLRPQLPVRLPSATVHCRSQRSRAGEPHSAEPPRARAAQCAACAITVLLLAGLTWALSAFPSCSAPRPGPTLRWTARPAPSGTLGRLWAWVRSGRRRRSRGSKTLWRRPPSSATRRWGAAPALFARLPLVPSAWSARALLALGAYRGFDKPANELGAPAACLAQNKGASKQRVSSSSEEQRPCWLHGLAAQACGGGGGEAERGAEGGSSLGRQGGCCAAAVAAHSSAEPGGEGRADRASFGWHARFLVGAPWQAQRPLKERARLPVLRLQSPHSSSCSTEAYARQVSELRRLSAERKELVESIFRAPEWADAEPLASLWREEARLRKEAGQVWVESACYYVHRPWTRRAACLGGVLLVVRGACCQPRDRGVRSRLRAD